MLLQLRIKNIALIDELTVEFKEGMNCLTGETGAGKSIIIDSIQCMLGFRTSKELIKSGCTNAFTEGIFYTQNDEVLKYLEELGIEAEEDNSIILQRELSTSGRNVCRVNGRIVPVSALRQLGSLLIDIHGQNDNQNIVKAGGHMKLLDEYGAEDISDIKAKYKALLNEFKSLYASLDNYSGDPKERERLADLYQYQIDEIDEAELIPVEEDELREKRDILNNAGKISEALNVSKDILKGGEYGEGIGAIDAIKSVVLNINSISSYSEDYSALLGKIEEISYTLEDICDEIRGLSDNVYFDQNELDEIEERLEKINKLKRKYGESIEEILSYRDNTQKQLDELLSAESTVKEILDNLKKQNEELYEMALKINELRVEAAEKLSCQIVEELKSLEMGKTIFDADIKFDNSLTEKGYYDFSSEGLSGVEFLISSNPGEPLKPLSKIASGGELSRIMLAIKTILADADSIPTLIFDEIDTGISGRAANSVARKLKIISKNHQVICVTHHAQLAAAADNNIYINKIFEDNNTKTIVETLDENSKIKEVARLLDGDCESEITMVHAKDLISKF